MAKRKDNKIQLRKEIAGLLDQIDEEGLLFLKKQATTIIYNETVQEMNRKNQESLLDNHRERRDEDSVIRDKEKNGPPEKKKIYVDMEGESKGYCNVVCGNVRVFFPLDEMGTMVYIAEKAAKSGDAGLLLYRWLKKERGDFLVDNGIKSYPSPTIDDLASYLAET